MGARDWENKMIAQQCSQRGGQLHCELKEDRCWIGGTALTYLKGHIQLLKLFPLIRLCGFVSTIEWLLMLFLQGLLQLFF